MAAQPCTVVTGATGFLGAFLLHALLRNSALGHWDPAGCSPRNAAPPHEAGKIVCLVRASSVGAGRERLETSARFYGLWDAVLYARVEVVCGDVALRWFGLDCPAFSALALCTRAVYHCAAQVSGVQPCAALYGPNVAGTVHVLELVLHPRQSGPATELTHISTLGFLPPGRADGLPLLASELVGVAGYGQSKWLAEQLVLAAAKRPNTAMRVFRPGSIAGSPTSGACNVRDSCVLLLRGLVLLGVVCPTGELLPQAFNLCPVDWVAHTIATTPFVCGHVQPLSSPQTTELAELCRAVRSAGYTLRDVAADEFAACISTIDDTHPLFHLKTVLTSGAHTVGQARLMRSSGSERHTGPSSTRFEQGPPGPGVELRPYILPDYVPRWLQFLARAGLLPAPPAAT